LNVRNSTTSAILRCSVHFTIYMYLYLYSYRRETARQLRMYAQLTRCFSAVAELLVYLWPFSNCIVVNKTMQEAVVDIWHFVMQKALLII